MYQNVSIEYINHTIPITIVTFVESISFALWTPTTGTWNTIRMHVTSSRDR